MNLWDLLFFSFKRSVVIPRIWTSNSIRSSGRGALRRKKWKKTASRDDLGGRAGDDGLWLLERLIEKRRLFWNSPLSSFPRFSYPKKFGMRRQKGGGASRRGAAATAAADFGKSSERKLRTLNFSLVALLQPVVRIAELVFSRCSSLEKKERVSDIPWCLAWLHT